MVLKENLRQKLHVAIEKLPEDRLQPVLDLVDQLLPNEKSSSVLPASEQEPVPARDPLLDYIGGINHGTLAQDVDKELYGV